MSRSRARGRLHGAAWRNSQDVTYLLMHNGSGAVIGEFELFEDAAAAATEWEEESAAVSIVTFRDSPGRVIGVDTSLAMRPIGGWRHGAASARARESAQRKREPGELS